MKRLFASVNPIMKDNAVTIFCSKFTGILWTIVNTIWISLKIKLLLFHTDDVLSYIYRIHVLVHLFKQRMSWTINTSQVKQSMYFQHIFIIECQFTFLAFENLNFHFGIFAINNFRTLWWCIRWISQMFRWRFNFRFMKGWFVYSQFYQCFEVR